MKYLLINDCLESMAVLVDTREQPTKKAFERYKKFGKPYKRCTLDYGDYTWQFTLNDKPFFNETEKIYPFCMVERKMNLDELAMCFTRDRKRFEAEMQRAKSHNAEIFLLVENASWENLINGKYRSKFNAKAFEASLIAWQIRYGLRVIFCKSETSGELIKEILYRDLKERLERGDFDCLIKDI